MASRTRTTVVAAGLTLACAGLAVWVGCAPRARLRPGEPLPLQMTFRNTGRDAVYMSLLVGGSVLDDKGERVVPPGPIPSPPEPPAEDSVRIGGSAVSVEAVEEVQKGASITRTLADVLAVYHPLPPGRYTVIPVASIATYDAAVVIRREDRDPKTWARPEKATRRFELESSPIAFEVR